MESLNVIFIDLLISRHEEYNNQLYLCMKYITLRAKRKIILLKDQVSFLLAYHNGY